MPGIAITLRKGLMMKYVRASLMVASALAAIIPDSDGQNQKEPAEKRYVVIDCAPFNSEPDRNDNCNVWLELETLNGKKYNCRVRDIMLGRSQGSVLADIIVNYCKMDDWKYERKGDQIKIMAVTNDKKETSEIAKISLTTENIPPNCLPRVIASKNVEVVQKRK